MQVQSDSQRTYSMDISVVGTLGKLLVVLRLGLLSNEVLAEGVTVRW